jgi:hypothetical protein
MKTRIELEETGNKILNAVRTELYLSMRFMGPALGSLGFRMDLSTRTVGTDAAFIRFNPTYLLHMYIERPEILNRTYMHMLMHCIFRHMFSAKEHEDSELWNLCCDIAVESVVDSMEYPTILRVTSDFRQQWYEKLEKEVSVLTAEKLYHYFILRKRDPYMEESLRQEFALCDHSFWERMEPPGDNDDQPKAGMDNETNSEETQQNQPQAGRLFGGWFVIGHRLLLGQGIVRLLSAVQGAFSRTGRLGGHAPGRGRTFAMLQAVFPPEWLRLCGNGETLPGQQGVQPFGVIAGFQQKGAVERVIEHGALLEVQVRIAVNAAQHPLQGRGQHLGDAAVQPKAEKTVHITVAAAQKHVDKIAAEPLQVFARKGVGVGRKFLAPPKIRVIKQFGAHLLLLGGGEIVRGQVEMQQVAFDD